MTELPESVLLVTLIVPARMLARPPPWLLLVDPLPSLAVAELPESVLLVTLIVPATILARPPPEALLEDKLPLVAVAKLPEIVLLVTFTVPTPRLAIPPPLAVLIPPLFGEAVVAGDRAVDDIHRRRATVANASALSRIGGDPPGGDRQARERHVEGTGRNIKDAGDVVAANGHDIRPCPLNGQALVNRQLRRECDRAGSPHAACGIRRNVEGDGVAGSGAAIASRSVQFAPGHTPPESAVLVTT